MPVPWDKRYPIEFCEMCPEGTMLLGRIEAANEFQSKEDRAKGRPVRQQVDPVTGLRLWKGTFNDPAATRESDKSFQVLFTSDHQPVPPEGVEVAPGMVVHPCELEGVTVQPRVEGNGEFKRLGYVVRATRMRATGADSPATRQAGVAGQTAKPAESKPGDSKATESGGSTGKAVA
jgi:hypothetical protein